jgi:oligosaccharide repeat unit polymerase
LIKTKVWFSGNVSAYSIWYDQIRNNEYSFGRYTLGGISEWLGFSYREVGVYTNSFDVNGKMSFSNIYTLFRFLIDDFGKGGCLIILFMLGYICKKLYSQCVNGNLVSVSVLSGIYSLLLFSFIASAWAYNSVLMAWFVFVFLIFITQRSNYDRQ